MSLWVKAVGLSLFHERIAFRQTLLSFLGLVQSLVHRERKRLSRLVDDGRHGRIDRR